MERGEWRVERGAWGVESGAWSVERGEWSVESGEWSVERGAWSLLWFFGGYKFFVSSYHDLYLFTWGGAVFAAGFK